MADNESLRPRTEERGQRTPPPRRPPTAVGAATPPPPRMPRRVMTERHERPVLYYVVGALALIGLAIVRGLRKVAGEHA